MTLSDRLLTIAENIEKGQTMADIGSDHGFLPEYLWTRGICPKIIVTDLSKDSLEKARKAFPADPEGVDFREGDGLKPLGPGEIDVVVIAGMGGVLITQILGEDPLKSLSFKKYILQPRNGAGKLRFWLEKAGFDTVSEDLAREGNFICEIISALPPCRMRVLPDLKEYTDEIGYEIPRNLKAGRGELFLDFIKKKAGVERDVLEEMKRGHAGKEALDRVISRLEFLNEILSEAGGSNEIR